MAGFAGMGKSTLARAIGRATGAVVVDLDVLKSAALDGGVDWQRSSQIAYEGLYATTEDLVRQGFSVIMDCPCRFERIVEAGMAIAARHGADYGYVECHLADQYELRRRLRSRTPLRSQGPDLGVPPSDAPPDAYAPFIDADGDLRVPPSCYPTTPWIRVDTGRPTDECLADVLSYLTRLRSPGRVASP
ncbi:MAG TPA: AAA family ATPase [Chloroflexota bacterium]|nr:AAA family ATPase [Chloroflexota bacterium]